MYIFYRCFRLKSCNLWSIKVCISFGLYVLIIYIIIYFIMIRKFFFFFLMLVLKYREIKNNL